MVTGMLMMALGIAGVAWLPRLPPLWLFIVAGVFLAVCYRRRRCWWWGCCAALLCGVGWGSVFGYWICGGLLPAELEQQSLLLTGRVSGLVETATGFEQKPVLRFQFAVARCETAARVACAQAPRRVQLSWYGGDAAPDPGALWQLRVKLKRPRGFANPAGFDYAAWLVANRIGATGYVERSADNTRLRAPGPLSIDAWRARARAYLQQRLQRAAHRDLLLGLLVGDGSAIDQAQWKTFRATGTVHLFVVSGLQIALSGGLVLWLSRLWWRTPFAVSSRRSYWLGALPAALVALAYALLAGFGLPLQRALIMFGLLLWTLCARTHIRPMAAWSGALWLVLLGDPLAVRDAGFWFSFAVVGVLLAATLGRREASALRPRWWRAQWAVFVASLPLLMAMTGQFTLLALPANLVAIPLSTLVSMPLALLAVLADSFAAGIGDYFWRGADLSLDWLCRYLLWLQQHGARLVWHAAGVDAAAVAIGAAVAALMLLPRGFPGRALALWLLPPLLWPPLEPIAPGASRVTVVDVGQGLSVLIETARHALLYDTGPPFGPERSVAELALTPLLHWRGIEKLDAVVISHRDNDHAGGWAEIESEFGVARLLTGEPLDREYPGEQRCRAGMQWRWDGIEFAVLYPAATGGSGNNASCVLQIRSGASTILLTGDIESGAEYRLLDNSQLLPATLLLAPHHGSKSSSTAALIERVQPRYVVFSSGYRNRFNHPHPAVVQRYRDAGAALFNTAADGALIFDFDAGDVAQITRARTRMRHYWD